MQGRASSSDEWGGEKGVEIFLTADLMRCRGVRDVTWGLDLLGIMIRYIGLGMRNGNGFEIVRRRLGRGCKEPDFRDTL